MVEGGKDKSKNPMRDLRIRKLCLNICVGESGDRLTRAGKVGNSMKPRSWDNFASFFLRISNSMPIQLDGSVPFTPKPATLDVVSRI